MTMCECYVSYICSYFKLYIQYSHRPQQYYLKRTSIGTTHVCKDWRRESVFNFTSLYVAFHHAQEPISIRNIFLSYQIILEVKIKKLRILSATTLNSTSAGLGVTSSVCKFSKNITSTLFLSNFKIASVSPSVIN